jgi:hypothetical protein
LTQIDAIVVAYIAIALAVGVVIGVIASRSYWRASRDPDWDGGL